MAKGGDVSPDVVDHIPPCCCRLQCHLAQPDNYENDNNDGPIKLKMWSLAGGNWWAKNHHLVWTSPGIWRTVMVFFLGGSGRRPPSIAPSWGERKEKQHPIVTRISLLNLFVFLYTIFLISQTPVESGENTCGAFLTLQCIVWLNLSSLIPGICFQNCKSLNQMQNIIKHLHISARSLKTN